MKFMASNFVEYSTSQIEIFTSQTKIFEFSKMCRYVLHLQTSKNIGYSLKSRPISHFEKSTFRFFGSNSKVSRTVSIALIWSLDQYLLNPEICWHFKIFICVSKLWKIEICRFRLEIRFLSLVLGSLMLKP